MNQSFHNLPAEVPSLDAAFTPAPPAATLRNNASIGLSDAGKQGFGPGGDLP